jgi:SAM-dependent methyltransferase
LNSPSTDELFSATYDRVAARYDDLWSRHVQTPNDRLTRGLGLRRGERLVDLACGSGAATLPMMRLNAPGETVAVDPSEGMLSLAREAALGRGRSLTAIQAKAEDFIAAAPPRPSTSCRCASPSPTSTGTPSSRHGPHRPQRRPRRRAHLPRHQRPASAHHLPSHRREHGDGDRRAPHPQVARHRRGAARPRRPAHRRPWQHGFRLWFGSGVEATRWLLDTGYVTHPALKGLEGEVLDGLVELFGAHLDGEFREDEGLPLDFFVAGILARRV